MLLSKFQSQLEDKQPRWSANMVQQELSEDKTPNLVTILVLGDHDVGKTSIISSLVTGAFDPNIPRKLEDVYISAQVCPDNVPLCIIDSSETEQKGDQLEEDIKRSHIVCVVYVAGDDDSLNRVFSHWIPIVRAKSSKKDKSKKPVFLVANKVDLLEDRSIDKATSILQDLEEIENSIEVSAKTQKNITELFYSAQKSVIYPLAPLFDSNNRELTKKCRDALIDIFQHCDVDGDGLLNDHEINLFQENCFGTPLHADALDDLKSIIKQSTKGGVIDGGMTQQGFLFLHTLTIDKGNHSFTWQVLRKFNYDNQIELKSSNEVSELKDALKELSLKSSLSSQIDSKSLSRSASGLSSENSEDHQSQIETSWVDDNSRMIKAGLGFTMATLVSMLALKYLAQSFTRNFL